MPAAVRTSRLERLLVGLGAVGLVVAVGVVLAWPEAPPTKGAGGAAPAGPAFALLVPGLLLVVGSVRAVVGGWRTRAWPRAAGAVAEARPLGRLYRYVRWRYAVGGAEHAVEEVRYALGGDRRFREGAAVAVRYDPSDPARAALEPTVHPASAAALAVGVVVVGLSAAMLG